MATTRRTSMLAAAVTGQLGQAVALMLRLSCRMIRKGLLLIAPLFRAAHLPLVPRFRSRTLVITLRTTLKLLLRGDVAS